MCGPPGDSVLSVSTKIFSRDGRPNFLMHVFDRLGSVRLLFHAGLQFQEASSDELEELESQLVLILSV